VWVTLQQGQILIRGHPIQQLALNHGFLENISFHVHGNEPPCDDRSWNFWVEESLRLLKEKGELLKQEAPLRESDFLIFIENVLDNLESTELYKSYSRNNSVAEAALTWTTILSEISLHYHDGRWPDDVTHLVYAMAKSLCSQGRDLSDTQVWAIERHMSLQIESPNSPSSQEFWRALRSNLSLIEALRIGIGKFWRLNHGRASCRLANLLLKFRSDINSIDSEVSRMLDDRKKIPGFGSFGFGIDEHGKSFVDPRISTYSDIVCEVVNSTEWYRLVAEKTESAFSKWRKQQRNLQPLPRNPDFYMTLLHFNLDIEPVNMPLSFLVARTAGWCAGYAAMKQNHVG
jgi:citrate synthase